MIGIYNLEPQYFNLALEKVKKFYTDKGEYCEDYIALKHNEYDKVYASSIFNFTDKQFLTPDMIVGGTGIDIKAKLPDEMENIKIRQNKGFTMRGCIRKCSFCVVPEKEGKARPVGDIYDIWDGKSKEIILYDNNILALPEHFKLICSQLRKEKLKVDWNQALDHRLLTDDICAELKTIKMIDTRFAFDSIKYEKTVDKAIAILNKYNIKAMWYVLVGYDETFENDKYRIEKINKTGQRAFAMKHSNKNGDKTYTQLCRWTNSPLWRNSMSWEDFLKRQEAV